MDETFQEISRWNNIKEWNQRPFRQRWFHYYVLFPEIVHILQNADYLEILDYGCGDGFLSMHLKNCFPKSTVVAYDVVDRMRNMTRLNTKNIIVLEALKKEHFDVICLNMVLQDVNQPLELLTSLRNYLNKDGIIIISVPHPVYSLIEKNHMTTRRERLVSNQVNDIFRYPFEEVEKVYWSSDLDNWTYLYNRTFQTYTEIIYNAGFSIVAIREPLSLPDGMCESDLYEIYSTIPGCVVFVCTKRF